MPYRSDIPASAPMEIILNACCDSFCSIPLLVSSKGFLVYTVAQLVVVGKGGGGEGGSAAEGKREMNILNANKLISLAQQMLNYWDKWKINQ